MCTKRIYTSKEAAKRAHRQAGWRIRVYECDECGRGCWHVTNNEKQKDPQWSDDE